MLTPAAAWDRLKSGNANWVGGRLQHPNLTIDRRREVAAGQHPFAAIVSCIDSRVPPESVFDQGLGDLFVVRTGAHTIDDLVTGSIEYGPVTDETPLIVALGHQRCGAITAAVEAVRTGKPVPDHLADVVNALRPAVAVGLRKGGDVVDASVRAQIDRTVEMLQNDRALADRLKRRELAIVGAYYSLDTGEVSVVRAAGIKA
jgi:carbonic anhydrase